MRDFCTSEIQPQLRSNFGYTASSSTPVANTSIVLYILLFVPGIFFTLAALSAYRLLDNRLVMGLMLSAYLLPVALLIANFALNRPSGKWLSAVFICASSALVLLAFLLFINGRMDKFPRSETSAGILRKIVLRGKYGTKQYHIMVSSWRAGRSLEDLTVGEPAFNRMAVGTTVTVHLHRGFLGLPWYEQPSPR
jgi:uncharacterized membrane protein YhaH (DUF805 family)